MKIAARPAQGRSADRRQDARRACRAGAAGVRANRHGLAGIDWEIYGDWTDDATKLETTVCYLLA
jgi:hypothetical protein